MPNIVIKEIDNTRPGGQSFAQDVVFIPGFVDINSVGDSNNLIPVNQPTLFTSLNDFQVHCGGYPAQFSKDQKYSDFESGKGFNEEAIPEDDIMFTRGAYDPAYIMAKEILASGLSVVYERINSPIIKPQETGVANPTSESKSVSFDILKFYSNADNTIFTEVKASGNIVSGTYYIINNDNITDATQVTKDTNSNQYTKIQGSELINIITDVTTGETAAQALGITISGSTYTFNNSTIVLDLPPIYSETMIKNNNDHEICIAIDGDKLKFENRYDNERFIKVDTIYQLFDLPDTWEGNSWYYYDDEVQAVNEYNTPTVSGTLQFRYPGVGNALYYNTLEYDISIKRLYSELENVFTLGDSSDNPIFDKGNISFKYLTSGGYPVFEYNNNSLVTKMLAICERRGDCVAFIDHTNNPSRTLDINSIYSLYHKVQDSSVLNTNSEYASMFTPWVTYNRITTDKDLITNETTKTTTSLALPASFAYLTCLADSIKTNANWLAVAGVNRGLVPNISEGGMSQEISNGLADLMQPRGENEGESPIGARAGRAINAITYIQPYGYTIWGNRTLKNNTEGLVATSFLNIRNLVSDVKKLCYRVARRLTFEQNNDILWINFKAGITPLLDNMLTGYGISGYKFLRDTENEHAREKATLCAKIVLYPVYAVEDFYISIILEDDEVTVE